MTADHKGRNSASPPKPPSEDTPMALEASSPAIPWLLETGPRRNMATARSKPQQSQQLRNKSHALEPTDQEQHRTKRRKHDGIRFGLPPPTTLQQQAPLMEQHQVPEQRQAVNYQQIEHSKAQHQLHGRKYQLNTSSCALPGRDQLFTSAGWSLPQMMAEKGKLNATKDMLDCKDIKPWGAHTAFTNRAGNVVRHIRQRHGEVELCTTAWAKMYECIVTFDLLPDATSLPSGSAAVGHAEGSPQAVGTVHLCEAPGAFISATNHFIRTQRPDWHWEWIGNSLHPYYEGNDPAAMIDDDALIQATLQHWHWGEDGSGDIRRPHNVAAICASAGAMALDLGTGGALLVTADGSIDCQENPNEQEMSTAALHYCEMVTALGVLAPGGSFILKAFTLFEHPTVCALYLMGALFGQVHVYKPATSKPGNSETYIIGKHFLGIDPDLHDFLVSRVSEDVYEDKALLPLEHLSADFQQSCIQCAAYFAGIQQQVITDNLASDQFLPPQHRSAINAAKQWMAEEWPHHFRLKPLPRDRFLAPHAFLSGSNNNTSNPVHKREKHDGTLAERVALGKRRREQLGIQTPSDRQHQPISGSESGAVGSNWLAGPAVAAGDRAVGSSGPDGRGGGGVAESMMQKWGYTQGKGLGKDLQGIAHKLDATANKGKSGLGLGQNHPQEAFATPKYSPQPDAAILTNEQAVLSLDEMEWWRIMQQKKPAKLLRSKFLPQDDILVALRSARELVQSWLASLIHTSNREETNEAVMGSGCSQKTGCQSTPRETELAVKPHQDQSISPEVTSSSPGSAPSSLEAARSSPGASPGSLKSPPAASKGVSDCPRAVPCSPETFCLHQGPCIAPQGRDPLPAFWHMASLDSAFSICSSLTTSHQEGASTLCMLDLSRQDCGATQYVLSHGGVTVQSAQLMAGAATQKLMTDASSAGTELHILPMSISMSANEESTAVQSLSAATASETTTRGTVAAMKALAEMVHTEVVDAAHAHAEAALPALLLAAAAVDAIPAVDKTVAVSAVEPDNFPNVYSLAWYEALQPTLKPVSLVIGSLCPMDGQQGLKSEGQNQSIGNLDGQTDASTGPRLPVKGESSEALGVMEAEYGREYRARLLWECAVALSCLQPGGAFVVQLPDCLTTFTVSMVYLLMRSFSGLSLVKPFTSCAATGARFLVCFGRLDDGNVGALWLTEVMRYSEQLSSSGKIVGEFVPPSSYISSQLLEYLSRRNAALASLQTRALQYMKDQHDKGFSHDQAQQAQNNLEAKQQLKLQPQLASPELTTPAQNSPGLHRMALRPALGFGSTSEASETPFAQQPMAVEPETSHNHVASVSHPIWSLHDSHQQQQHSQTQQQLQWQQSQQLQQQDLPESPEPSRGDEEAQNESSSVKQWQGPLCVVGHKGEEFVCDLTTATWPASLPRPVKLRVLEYMPADKAMQAHNLAPLGQMQLVKTEQAKALQGFTQYLTGFRGAGRPMSQPKMAVVKTQSYMLLLEHAVDSAISGTTLKCWLLQ